MKLSDFDYELPPGRIAQEPPGQRESARLMYLNRKTGAVEHLRFPQILDLLEAGDVLVLNDTRVIPAKLFGTRQSTGGKVEALLVQPQDDNHWHALLKTRGKLQDGETILFGKGKLVANVAGRHAEDGWRIRFQMPKDELLTELTKYGVMPLPPYIKRQGEFDPRVEFDRERYQTIFAREPGAIAAPTAGLHFTDSLLERIRRDGIEIVSVTLHVGLGTFKPVTAEDPRRHQMHAERYTLSDETASAINRAKDEHRRIIAVGTTACRTLESCASECRLQPASGWTSLFIYPLYEFQVIDGLITNFHLPRSTLLMLVAAFAGRERILNAYQEAITEEYRFYSYGDAMVIL